MSVWPSSGSASPLLAGSEGPLVSVAIHVEPRYLESLLEALAHVDFPINPQIYHDAAVTYLFEDGREQNETVTLVEFPAYVTQLGGLKRAMEAFGFDPASLCVTDMLSSLHSENRIEAAPPGAAYQAMVVRKRRDVARDPLPAVAAR
jgi:hypothetical protein